MKNLTDPLLIRHALEIKLGPGALTTFANNHMYSVPYVSMTIAGHRNNRELLEKIADCIGSPVYGVMPKKLNKGENL